MHIWKAAIEKTQSNRLSILFLCISINILYALWKSDGSVTLGKNFFVKLNGCLRFNRSRVSVHPPPFWSCQIVRPAFHSNKEAETKKSPEINITDFRSLRSSKLYAFRTNCAAVTRHETLKTKDLRRLSNKKKK